MATQIIPFDSDSKLPAYLKKYASKVSNEDLTEGVGSSFPFLSIKGKTWTVVRSKEDRKILRSRHDPDEVASNVAVVILRASKHLGRVFYKAGFEEGKSDRPDCFSHDSVKPDASVESPQSKTCAACKHAVFVQGKGPACRQSRRLAVAPVDAINDPMLLRVPAASLKNLNIYGNELAKRNVPYHVVVTKIQFDAEEATPKLLFKPLGFVPEETLEEIEEVRESNLVDQILGVTGEVEGEPAPEVDDDEDAPSIEEVEKAITPKATPKAKAKAKPEPEEEVEEKPKAKAKAKPEPEESDEEEVEEKPKAKAKADDGGLDGLLEGFDD
ncbi:MAG: hypothetical protein VBE63_08340 [Lamprobacter sp.]|uniref:hypothetical protein n=1 Tax=Lamprobacter sp. TaxID=3100796 RepID=UPI002B25EFDC|nr:hypothetical protein [Lamprobacter sp.]MEA3639938.1 hypothetical protein [Lamprobacter sp.]